MSLPVEARAQAPSPAAPPVFIELTSSDGCGTSHELGRRVAQRSERIHLAAGPDGAIVARAEIRISSRGSVEATLTLIERAGKRWSRQVHSANCDEALDAIALVVAVALDPQLMSAEPIPEPPPPPPPRARPQPPEPPRPPKPVQPEAEDARLRSQPNPIPEPPAPPAPPPPDVPLVRGPPTVDRARDPVPVAPRPQVLGVAGAMGLFSWGSAPRMMPGVSAFVTFGLQRGSVWSPAVQLRAAHFWMDGFAAPGGVADFALDSLALSLCPIWLQERRLAVHLCAAGEVGRLSVRGSQTLMPQSRMRPFAVMGGSATVMVELGLGIHLTGTIGGGAPLVRDSFQFRPEVFYQIPVLVLTTGAGVGMRFL